jgi:hypothetical protein
MNRDYSIIKIIKNKIGYVSVLVWLISIICFVISLAFIDDFDIKIHLFFLSIFLFSSITICSIIDIIRINYYFKNSIELKAIVRDDTYAVRIFDEGYLGMKLYNRILSPWYDIDKEIKNGVVYEYKIDGEIYKNSYTFVINSDTMFLKDGSIITILVNQKNKNKTIIKDIYV